MPISPYGNLCPCSPKNMVLFEEIQTHLDNCFSSSLFVNEKENSEKGSNPEPLDCKEILTTALISFLKIT